MKKIQVEIYNSIIQKAAVIAPNAEISVRKFKRWKVPLRRLIGYMKELYQNKTFSLTNFLKATIKL